MNNGSDKIYLGNCREKSRRNGDKFLTGLIALDDIDAEALSDYIFVGNNGKRYLRIVINPYQEGANQYGNTHSISVDTFKPDASRGSGGNSNNSGYGNNAPRNNYSGNNRSGSYEGNNHQSRSYDGLPNDNDYNNNRSSQNDDYAGYDLEQ